jgi:hypothetical protein
VRSEVFTAVAVKITLRYVTRVFRKIVSEECATPIFMMLFYPEDGGSTLPRTVGNDLPDYTADVIPASFIQGVTEKFADKL